MIGRYRDTENGKAVNVQGRSSRARRRPSPGASAGLPSWQQLLSTTEYVQQCFAVQASRFALARDEAAADACSLKSAWDAFSAGGQLNIRQLMVATTGSYAFSHRNNVKAGQACR